MRGRKEGEGKKKERGERGRNLFTTRQQKYHPSISLNIISKNPLFIYRMGGLLGK